MLEMLIGPKKAERRPWEMFFVGAFYASVSILIAQWVFSKDAVLSQYSSIFVVTFTVMFSIPFMYYVIRLEEKKAYEISGAFNRIKAHRKALWAFLWLFAGFVVAFSFWYIILPTSSLSEAPIKTYCQINRPGNVSECFAQYGLKDVPTTTQFAITNGERLFLIFTNNIYVLIFTLVFSLIFGAGVIFILVWNGMVIGAAIAIFSESNLSLLPLALGRYFIHGIPEIASYFVGALAGGIISIAVIRRDLETEKFWEILQDSLNLIILAVLILFIAAFMEVFITPLLFS
ncbi:hypothetical protein AUJ84_03220 [Candidatus Pacearchaeota archaeon CG1_02_32_132]|nr:MAG: hypothetical protein AUJ84_03220 [Candidatus Pacearchaeota archaeon CG1_02_32_132]